MHYELYSKGGWINMEIPPPKLLSFFTATCSDFTNNVNWSCLKFPWVRLPCILLLILLINSVDAKGELAFMMTWQTQLKRRTKEKDVAVMSTVCKLACGHEILSEWFNWWYINIKYFIAIKWQIIRNYGRQHMEISW